MLRLRPAFEGCSVTYVTVRKAYAADLDGEPMRVINDATRWDKVGLAKMCLRLLWIVLRVRPDVVISTGAAPGYFAIRFAKLLGARAIWLDSIANAEEVSMTGELVGKRADLWMTQWEHLGVSPAESGPPGTAGRRPVYSGAVL